jgi:hypothetical protein
MTRTAAALCLGIATAALLTASVTEATQPTGVCVASMVKGRIVFSRLSHYWKAAADFGVPMRTDISAVRVYSDSPSERLLWEVQVDGPPSVAAIEYGEVPPNYSQHHPASTERPESLAPETEYSIRCGGGAGRFKFDGTDVQNLDPW